MDYLAIHGRYLKQIQQLNKLFLDLVIRSSVEDKFAGLSASAREVLTGCGPAPRETLASLPRALFQIRLDGVASDKIAPGYSHDAVRAFTITALLVAFNMVREGDFAARVLFNGSSAALDLLAGCELSELIRYSARGGVINCPSLERYTPASRFLASLGQGTAHWSRDVLIALTQFQPPGGLSQPGSAQLGAALSSAN